MHSSASVCTAWPAHLNLYLFILVIFSKEYKLLSFSLRNVLQPPVTSSLFGPNILLSTLFSNTLSLYSSLNVWNNVSHSCENTGKIISNFGIDIRKTGFVDVKNIDLTEVSVLGGTYVRNGQHLGCLLTYNSLTNRIRKLRKVTPRP
jgi:hypothetical protein